MNDVKFLPLSSEQVEKLRGGGVDAYGCGPEVVKSDGQGNPCRHCLDFVPKGADMLVVAHRPFDGLQPYAETGPIFLCADGCEAWSGEGVPPILTSSSDYLLKGYTADQRILYGTGKIVLKQNVADYASSLLENRDVTFVDVRSSRNNCFQTRIVRV